MTRKMPGACPVCGGEWEITRLRCTECATTLESHFRPCRYCQLNDEQLALLEAFIRTRGNLRDMEGVMNLSYPTIRNRLDALSDTLFPSLPVIEGEPTSRQLVLDMLEQGTIQPAEASQLLKRFR